MITDALTKLSSVFPRRFFFNALLPTLVFGSALLAILVKCLSSLNAASQWWAALDVLTKAITVLAYLAGIWFLSAAVASQWRNLVRLYEGYPLVRIFDDRSPGRAWHARNMSVLWEGDEESGTDPDRYAAYPRYPLMEDHEDVLPTRLGNILLAAERYSSSRYGMETIYFWPRLHPLLPEQFQRDYEIFVMNYEFPLVVSFQSLTVGVIGSVAIIATQQSPWLFLGWWVASLAIAYSFYVLSLAGAEDWGEQMRTAYDLYRGRVLDEWATPADVRDESLAFREIEDFIVSNLQPSWGEPQLRRAKRRKGPSGGKQ